LARHIGIELSPVACRIVEVSGERDSFDMPVAFYADAPTTSPATIARLSRLRGRHATVVVWGATIDHRVVTVSKGSYEHMHAQARAALRSAGGHAWQTLTDIAPVPDSQSSFKTHGCEASSRDSTSLAVVMASAAANEVTAMLRPVVAAGITIDCVLTPAAALLSLARMRRALAVEGAIDVYIAVDERATSMAIIRDLALIAAIDLPWGYIEERSSGRVVRSRGEMVSGLETALTGFLADCRVRPASLRQVCTGGSIPDLRSVSMALMERIDVEVEPLDSLFGIDAARLPGAAGDFRERVAGLRLAWAAAADDRPRLDLFRANRRRARRAKVSRAAVAAGIATGVIVGSQVAPSVAGVLRPRQKPLGLQSMRPLARPVIRPYVGPSFPPSVTARTESKFDVGPSVPPPLKEPGELRRTSRSGVTPTAVTIDEESSNAPTIVRAPDTPDLKVGPTYGAARKTKTPALESSPAPLLTATLQGILIASDRKLAIVDGRIVQPGDDVQGATVVDITATSIIVRDARGRLRSLTSDSVSR